MAVTGIGGLFFRAQDPDAVRHWYRTHLGIPDGDGFEWMQRAGPTVVMPFPPDTDYLPAGRSWMLNLRVDDLDALIATLRDAGITVTTDPTWDSAESGCFARVVDPEGNPIELWQPPAAS